ncbi:hypothetical protein BN159_0343 [Streptomyces davaonensis JCM 4913]|uniref:Uncharacterized protein n=1 Tax=Streptomyces davaonensis (strain DSM 101723 / JCM 4913 / KCC S-0913 / 768) TaxID=1214101 RepID=K4QUY1_STRDJ|nr:hypothetical protein BN159_0343 [Streptomyces davaonensis JCM 4913]
MVTEVLDDVVPHVIEHPVGIPIDPVQHSADAVRA